MFGKKCPNCGDKIGRRDNFCPICGYNLKKKISGGLLDEIDESVLGINEIRLPPGFNLLFNRLTREIEKQLREFDKTLGKNKGKEARPEKNLIPLNKSGISISISSASGKEPMIKIKSFGVPKEKVREFADIPKKTHAIKNLRLTKSQETKLARLPKQEPETKVRRLTNSIIYEIDLPGVKNKRDIIINKLENSIEIKALSKDKVFLKLIPVSMPLKRYDFRDGKLILELKPEV